MKDIKMWEYVGIMFPKGKKIVQFRVDGKIKTFELKDE